MLLSFVTSIGPILQTVVDTKATKIIDAGAGAGKYGLLIREAIASVRSESGDLCPNLKDLRIDAVESGDYFYENYPLHEIYNNVYHDDLFKIDDFSYNQYHLMLLIDVIEHHSKDKALAFLKNITTKVLISTPKHTVMYPDRHYDIDVHVSQWTPEDFKDFKYSVVTSNDSWIILLN